MTRDNRAPLYGACALAAALCVPAAAAGQTPRPRPTVAPPTPIPTPVPPEREARQNKGAASGEPGDPLREPPRELRDADAGRGGRSRPRRRFRGARRGRRVLPEPSAGHPGDRVRVPHAAAIREPDPRRVQEGQGDRVGPAARRPPAPPLHAERRSGPVRRARGLSQRRFPVRRPAPGRPPDHPSRRPAHLGDAHVPARPRPLRRDLFDRAAALGRRGRLRAGGDHAPDRRRHLHQQGAAAPLPQLHADHELRVRGAQVPDRARRVSSRSGPRPAASTSPTGGSSTSRPSRATWPDSRSARRKSPPRRPGRSTRRSSSRSGSPTRATCTSRCGSRVWRS